MKTALMIGISTLFFAACNLTVEDSSDNSSDNSSDDSSSDDSQSDGGQTQNPDDGSQTLYVDAHIEGESESSTHFEVEVYLSGEPLEGADVTVDSDLGTVTLNAVSSGRYEAHQSGFASSYSLYIELGDHFVEGQLSSPDPHMIVTPSNGSTYDTQSGDLLVTWSPTGADETRVESDESDLNLDGDPGNATIPNTAFDDDEDRIEVERTNRVQLSGGVGDSHLEISYRARSEISVQNPFGN